LSPQGGISVGLGTGVAVGGTAVAVGGAAWALFVFWAHEWLFGVNPLGT